MRFIRAYEDNFGNVTIACALAGIHRQTFYRWKESSTPVNVKFRRRLALARPEDKYVDFLEAAFNDRVEAGSESLIKFGLSTKGRHRGWALHKPDPAFDLLEKLVIVFNRFAASRRNATVEDRTRWVNMIAAKAGVDPTELAKKIGVDAGV